MSANDPAISAELLAHADWVRRLARRLVFDADSAEDVEQETWAYVLRRPPRELTNPRAWLAEVVRNAARQLGRRSVRRERRERAAAREESLPGVDAMVEQAETQRRLVALVLELDEPYKSVLLYRYFRDLEPAEIARRTDTSVHTVRTRLRRGVERLRERLDVEHGGREPWCAVLVPLVVREGAEALPPVAGASALVTGTLIKLAAALVFLAGAVGLFAVLRTPADEHRVPERITAPTDPVDARPTTPPAGTPTVPAAGRPRSEAAIATVAPPPAAAHRFVGRLLDLEGEALRGPRAVHWIDPFAVRWTADGSALFGRDFYQELPADRLEALRSDEAALDAFVRRSFNSPEQAKDVILGRGAGQPSAWSDGEGRFSIPVRHAGGSVALTASDGVVVARGTRSVAGGEESEHVFVVAPALELAGRVVDAEGAGVPDVEVELEAGLGGTVVGRGSVSWSRQRWPSTRSAADGTFDLASVPRLPGARLVAHAADGRTARVLADAGSREVELRLSARPEPARPVHGVVRTPDGRPAPRVAVHVGGERTTTGPDGRFALHAPPEEGSTGLLAWRAGEQPVVLSPAELEAALGGELALFIGSRTHAIRGRVIDAEGRGLSGFAVRLVAGTPWPRGVTADRRASLEELCAGGALTGVVETDADGAFAVEGLSDRSYRLRVWDPDTGLTIVGEPVRAGTGDLVVRLPEDGWHERAASRVVTRRGEPVAGARVLVHVPWPDGARTRSTVGQSAITDAQGAFELPRVPRGARISVEGTRLVSRSLDLGSGLPAEIRIEQRCLFVVRPAASDPATELALLDEHGAPLPVTTLGGQGLSTGGRVALGPEGSPTCEASDRAATLVLFTDGVERRRVPVELFAGGVQVITPR